MTQMPQRRKNRDNLQPAVPLLEYLMKTRNLTQDFAVTLIEHWQDYFQSTHEPVEHFLHRKGVPIYYKQQFLQWGNMEEALEQEAAAKKLKDNKLLERITVWVGGFIIVGLLAAIMGLMEGHRLQEELKLKCSYNPQSLECQDFLKTQYPQ